jgi:hypothetical protein
MKGITQGVIHSRVSRSDSGRVLLGNLTKQLDVSNSGDSRTHAPCHILVTLPGLLLQGSCVSRDSAGEEEVFEGV